MKVFIDTDEWYPVYTIINPSDPNFQWMKTSERKTYDIPDDLWARYIAAYKEFDAIQDILQRIGSE